MTIDHAFNQVAESYDQARRGFIPCFDAFYGETTKMIAANIRPPETILDLGAGTGLLTKFWLADFPEAACTLVDLADEMLRIAETRFAAEGFDYLCQDYLAAFPDGKFDAIISALSIHHLQDPDKQALFNLIYDHLPAGGIFVNYDQFCQEAPLIDTWIHDYWRDGLYRSNLTAKDLALWEDRSKLDMECSVAAEKNMLQSAGFSQVGCVFTQGKFSVIVAIKEEGGS